MKKDTAVGTQVTNGRENGVQMDTTKENATEAQNAPLGTFFLTENRTVRGSDATFRTDDPPHDTTLLKKDHGTNATGGRYEVFENVQHQITVKMDFTGDTILRLARYASRELWIKAQAKIRREIAVIGDEEFAKRLRKTDGQLTFITRTDFEPKSRAMSSGDKAVGEVKKIDDMAELDRLEEELKRQRELIAAKMVERHKTEKHGR